MDQVQVFTVITLVTTGVVGAVKKAWPSWTDKKEDLLALVASIVLVVTAKLTGELGSMSWFTAICMMVGSSLGSGIVHDKFVNGIMKKGGSAS